MKLLLTIWSVTLAAGLLSTAAVAAALESITSWISYGDHYAPGQITSAAWRLGIPLALCFAAAKTCFSRESSKPQPLELPIITAIALAGGLGLALISAALEKYDIIRIQIQSTGLSPTRIRFVETLCLGTGVCAFTLLLMKANRQKTQHWRLSSRDKGEFKPSL